MSATVAGTGDRDGSCAEVSGMIFSVSGISAIPRDSGHAPRYDPREPGRIPPPGLPASRLAVKIRHPGETMTCDHAGNGPGPVTASSRPSASTLHVPAELPRHKVARST